MRRFSIRRLRIVALLGQTLHQRLAAVAVIVCAVAVGAAAVLFDLWASRIMLGRVALDGEWLLAQLADAKIAHDIQRGERGLRVVFEQPLESSFRFDEGRAAFITLGDEVLWQSDDALGRPSGSRSPVQGRWEGIEAIDHAGRRYEAYVLGETVIREWPEPSSTTGLPEAETAADTYTLTYRVAIVTDRYLHPIKALRGSLAAVAGVALVVLGAVLYVVIRRQLRPLVRITRRVSTLEAWSGQRIRERDGDPQEIRTLTERFNEFLQKLDDTGGWEKVCHGKLRTVLRDAKRELSPDSQIGQKGFMHSLSHLLSAIPLTEFKTIPEEEKEAVHRDFMRVRSMIERKLHDLVTADAGEAARLADAVAVAGDFFARRGDRGENFMQSFMRRRHPERDFEHHHFELRHEDAPLLARIDKSDLYELMFNLLHNAGKAAHAQVRMTIARRAERVRIVVENDGKRFPPAVRENLMTWRDSTDGDGEGHGIGLPYVRRIARDHGGDLELEDSDDLGGARAVLELPLVDSSANDTAAPRAHDEAARRALAPENVPTS